MFRYWLWHLIRDQDVQILVVPFFCRVIHYSPRGKLRALGGTSACPQLPHNLQYCTLAQILQRWLRRGPVAHCPPAPALEPASSYFQNPMLKGSWQPLRYNLAYGDEGRYVACHTADEFKLYI